jgi:transcriptional regulator with XRE-family HTH domain
MKTVVHLPIPVIKVLRKLGEDINTARRRRRITIKLMAERAGVSRATIAKIERGDSTTSIGGYAAVLFVLGMSDRLTELVDGTYDLIGRRLEDEKLPQRVRMRSPKRRDNNEQ